jgi:hypothetical protein
LIAIDGMALTYVYKAAEEKIITIEKNKKYPVAMIIEGAV